jgi:hypothetical protein
MNLSEKKNIVKVNFCKNLSSFNKLYYTTLLTSDKIITYVSDDKRKLCVTVLLDFEYYLNNGSIKHCFKIRNCNYNYDSFVITNDIIDNYIIDCIVNHSNKDFEIVDFFN